MAETEPDSKVSGQSARSPGSEKIANLGLTWLFGIGAAAFVILAVTGTVRDYSPVPVLDMWDDYLGFYLKVHDGNLGAWWAQHNEHRILLARMFFWIDIAWFHGNGIFSLAVIYALVLMVGLVFALIWREQSQGQDLYIGFFVLAWIFSWSQSQNLTWAFQSQFILAQLLPLAALYLLHLSYSKPGKSKRYFWAATLCGVLAVGSMANGVLALPAMALYALIVERRAPRAIFFVVLSAGEIYLYFRHWGATALPGSAPTLTGEITAHPAEFIAFVLMYVGSPFIFLFNKTGFTHQAILAGSISAAALILLSSWAFSKIAKQARRASLALALLAFIFYIIATAAITAAGRLPLGLQEALSSRYLTPALYAWAAALLLFWPAIARSIRFRNMFSAGLAIFFCFVMFPRQLHAMAGAREIIYQRELSALPLELQIKDTGRIVSLYPIADTLISIANQSRQQHLSIFGFPPLGDAHLLLGKKARFAPMAPCQGSWDSVTVIPDAPGYVRVSGWVFNSAEIKAPKMVYLVNAGDEIVGLGLVGEPRADVARVVGVNAKYSGFEAYLSSAAKGQRISVVSPSQNCQLR